MLDTWVYPNKKQQLLLALLLLFAAYIGSRPCSLVDAAVKKVNKVIKSNTEETNPYNNSKTNKDEFSFASIDTNKLKSILYQDVIILAV